MTLATFLDAAASIGLLFAFGYLLILVARPSAGTETTFRELPPDDEPGTRWVPVRVTRGSDRWTYRARFVGFGRWQVQLFTTHWSYVGEFRGNSPVRAVDQAHALLLPSARRYAG